MMLIPRNYGLNLFDDIFNDSFFSNTPDKKEEVKKLPIMRTDIREIIFWKSSFPALKRTRYRLN